MTKDLRHLETLMKEEKNTELLRQPKYVQLADHILHMIETGVWEPGDQLPSEAEMAKSLPTSLGTIQKALGRLADHGAVVREQYRGTFVNGPRSILGPWHLRFLDDGKTLLPVNQKVQGIEKVIEEGEWQTFLGESTFYVCIKRMIDVNGEFNALSRFYLAGDKFGKLLDLQATDLDGMYMRTLLQSRFGTQTLRVVEELTCDVMPDDVCQTLGLALGSVGMVFHIMSYGYRDEPVYYHLVFVPPNKRHLEVRQNRN